MPPEGTTPARGAGRARGRGTRGRGAGRGTSASVTPSAEAPAPISRPSSALGTATGPAGLARDSATPRPAPTRGTSVGRFRPKVVRRDEAARDAIARQELEKDNARAKAEARAQARSRGRSRRARGDAMGRGGFMSRTAVASGPFSQINIEGMFDRVFATEYAGLTFPRWRKIRRRLGRWWWRRRQRRRLLRWWRRRGQSQERRWWVWRGIRSSRSPNQCRQARRIRG